MAWKHENVYIDTSAYLPNYYPPELIHYMKTYGKEKVLFGTNYPQLSYQKCVSQIESLGLEGKALSNFLSGNAIRVFKLDEKSKL